MEKEKEEKIEIYPKKEGRYDWMYKEFDVREVKAYDTFGKEIEKNWERKNKKK